MPVIDGVFVPRSPLTPAELHVDWAKTNAHVVSQRDRIERACQPAARRLGLLATHGVPPTSATNQLASRLERELRRTALFGYREARREIIALRAEHPIVTAAVIPDAGRYAQIAAQGLATVGLLISRRAREAAAAIASAAAQAALEARRAGHDTLAVATKAAARTLHLHVLELVGETLNQGRTAGAMSLPTIPEFALRSEQLDRNTCAPCDHLHGTITVVGSPEYFAVLPPIGCLGGGRCRGIQVYGDNSAHVAQPQLLAA